MLRSTLSALLTIGLASAAQAQTTTFTYQGSLGDNGSPATGTQDFEFRLFDAAASGSQVGSTVAVDDVVVTTGLFTVSLDFGAAFDGSARYLEISVRPGASAGIYTALTPRQLITAAPYALTAGSLSGTLPAVQLSGPIPSASLSGIFAGAVTFDNVANSFSGGGAGLTGLNASELATGMVPDARLAANLARTNQVWLLSGNAGTTAGTHFLGTTENQALELKVNNARALRIEPTGSGPNLVGGHPDNVVSSGSWGATISGGGGPGAAKNSVSGSAATIGGGAFNTVAGNYGVVGGGAENVASGTYATIGGGVLNEVGEEATIGGGYQNRAKASKAAITGGQWNNASGNWSFVGGGRDNTARSNYSAVVGGQMNLSQGPWSAVGGGQNNTIRPESSHATIAGGGDHSLSGSYSTVAGGQNNDAGISKTADHASIGGGRDNTIEGGSGGVIGGGVGNNITEHSDHAVIGGGQANLIEDIVFFTTRFSGHGTIGGGVQNHIRGQFATIGGGATNKAYFVGGTVAGGLANETWSGGAVGGGQNNVASGSGATVPGGYQNEASGNLSLAAGNKARATHARAFVWSSRDNPGPSFATNRFHVHAAEGFSVDYAGQRPDGGGQRWVVLGGLSDFPGQTISTWTGARLTDGGVWTDNSDRNAKDNFSPVDPRDILERVTTLPVQVWNYKAEGPSVRHIGPVAQDFYAAFHTGADDKHLAALDSAGVALAAIQGLNQKLTEELQQKQSELTEMKRRLDRVEQLLSLRLNAGGK